MEERVLAESYRMIDEYFPIADLNALLKQCVQDKAREGNLWSELTLCSHFMLGGSSSLIYKAAAQTELLILALDIMDDLQDRDKDDKPWMQCEAAYALNAVLAFITASLGDLSKYSGKYYPKIFQLIARSINGQQHDLNDSIRTENDYMEMVLEKSASLIKLAFCMGYLHVDNCDADLVAKLDELADYIGIIAQIQNDTLGLQRMNLTNDLFQKKRTLPIFFLLQQSKEKFPLFQQFYDGEITQEQLLRSKQKCMQFITDCGCIEYAKTIQFLHMSQVEQLFDALDCEPLWKARLRNRIVAAASA